MSGSWAYSSMSRQFLRQLDFAAGVTLTTSLIDDLNVVAKPKKPLSFVIVGAGLSGLCAAYELEQHGYSCTILEADTSYVGGRVRTLRFEDGLYGEAGAIRIPPRHELTRHYVKKFGLELRKFVHFNPEAYYYLRGYRERIKNIKQLNCPYKLNVLLEALFRSVLSSASQCPMRLYVTASTGEE